MEGIKGGQFKLLTKSQIYQIHQNTLKILEDPGIVVDEPTALKILDNAGAEVDFKQQRVKIFEELVEEAIKKAPKSFIVYARDRSNNLKIGGDRVYFSPTSTHPFVFDLDTGERRSTVFSDCEKLVRLNDCLEMVHGNVCPVHPTDVSERAAHAYIMLASASNTSKVFRGRNYGRQIAKDCIDMASILAGGEEELRKRPNMITIENTVSPLQHERTQVEGLLEYVKLGMPVGVSSEISAGATGPVTLAGSLVVQNAEVLTGIIITQLVNPGTPVLYGTVSNIMDMRTAQMSLGSIEAGILNVATAQLAHYYNIPCRGSAGATDSKILDMEAGYETALNILLATMGGVNYIQYCTGAIDLTLSVSYEKALIDNEVLINVARALRGIDVSEETLAVDLIRKVEPGGHFLSQKHTLSYLEKEHIIPELADRKRYGKWKESGGKDIRERARERVRQILADYKPQPLDKVVEERLKEKVKKIEKREAMKI